MPIHPARALDRRDFVKLATAGAACLALPGSRTARAADDPPAPAAPRPNILLIVADDLGYAEPGCQGGKEIPTPYIDSLAVNGVRFTSGYVSAPLCSPTRAGLMTGRYQQRFGHEFNPGPENSASEEFGLPLSETPLPKRLKAAGYATGMVGKWHLGYNKGFTPPSRGFDEFFGFHGGGHSYMEERRGRAVTMLRGEEPVTEKEYLTDAFAREATSFIDRHKADPFFLYLPFNAVHAPLQAPERYLNRFSGIRQENRRTFAAMLSAMDDAIGAVLAHVREAGIEERTLIFFVSDNGGPTPSTTSRNDPLRGYKATAWEGGVRVPFLAQWKGRLPAGLVYPHPVISLDIHPTALAAAGIAPPPDAKFDGVDIIPHLTDPAKGGPHETLYWRLGPANRAVRHGDLKLLCPEGEAAQLFDLAADIGESHDLAADRPEEAKKLGELYRAWDATLAEPKWGRKGRRRR